MRDPNFIDKDMDNWVVSELVKYCDNVRKMKTFTNRNYDAYKGDGCIDGALAFARKFGIF